KIKIYIYKKNIYIHIYNFQIYKMQVQVQGFQPLYDYLIKIVLVGDSGVGKSNILSRFTRDQFQIDNCSTIGVEFGQRIITTENKIIQTQIWDTAGTEKFQSITQQFFRGALGVLLIYDITKQASFQQCEKLFQQIKDNVEDHTQILLVGNKTDISNLRTVSKQEGLEFAKTHKIQFIEVSALENINIDQAFMIVVQQIYELCQKSYVTVETDKKIQLKDNVDKIKIAHCCTNGVS
ncbi:Ras-related protein ric2, putative, partial [Ichthyophthirius multifiliis]